MVSQNDVENVILIHGLARTAMSMRLLGIRLRKAGFRCAFIDYESRRLSLDGSLRAVTEKIARETARVGQVHLVGHSLGGLLGARIKLARPDLPIQRVVQLGSPNLGSGAARRLREVALAQWVFGPVLRDLAEDQAEGLEPDADIAAFAGTGFPVALARHYDVEGPNDGLVAARSAWGRAAKHRVMASGLHTWLPLSGAVAEQVVGFLKTGEVKDAL